MRTRLRAHLMPASQMRADLHAAGAPSDAAEIGVSRDYLRQAMLNARFLRSRYTLLDLLDETGLRQEDGTPIAPLDDIASIDRALFSFKPSNGFLIRLRAPLGRAWVPGMWWRIGRRVGIGGVTGGAETKMMADALSMMVAERDAREGGFN